MPALEYRLRFWGVRGTVATPEPDKLRLRRQHGVRRDQGR